ncbi:MAG: GNAT family N-acetyltransferase [Actinomyces urogenitalis]|uniref:GNAT family N-acetyltransferase n=1 Tax=Actinomyces urogenitalis TaxID=103621 RepID=UPI00242A9476|nr:GNAT family N-acetyltransferase [Actinomyces urogenitalis]MCI7456470.1 GNAT family N-acetyltransferase [Actinomyces urogenitalis]MDY3678911.1 GNAT family N-acetyltransferase [Actinomyces urogenitalis]
MPTQAPPNTHDQPESVSLRLATADDLAEICRVEHAADTRFADIGLQCVLDAPQAQPEDHAEAQQDGRLIVAESRSGGLVGFARIDVVDGAAHLEQVSVAPSAAGQGVGAVLIRAAERWSRDHGYDRMTLCTYRDVPWNAPYYQRLGWRPLDDAELGTGLRGLREHEKELGLEVSPRLAMVKELS